MTGFGFKGECFKCRKSGHVASNCYKSQFDKFINRNRSRNTHQPRFKRSPKLYTIGVRLHIHATEVGAVIVIEVAKIQGKEVTMNIK